MSCTAACKSESLISEFMAEALSLNGEWNLHSREETSVTRFLSLHKNLPKEA